MKIMPGHYDAMKKAINEVFDNHGGKAAIVKAYESGNFPRAEKVKDLQMRFCFDLLHAANISGLMSEIYEYANDSHIFTALKKICPQVTRQY